MQNLQNLQNLRSMQGKGGGLVPFKPSKLDAVTAWFKIQYENVSGLLQAKDEIGKNTFPQRVGTCYDLDGSNDFITLPSTITVTDFDYSWTYKSTVDNFKLIGDDANTDTIKIASTTQVVFRINGSNNNFAATNLLDGVLKVIRVTRDGTVAKMYINGILIDTITVVTTAVNWKLLMWQGTGNKSEGKVRDIILTGYATYHCEEENNTLSLDSSGNGNHAVITANDIDVFHATDVDVTKSFANDVGYSTNLILNPGFDSDTDWFKSGNWTISSGAARNDGGSGAIFQSTAVTVLGSTYQLTFDIISLSSGRVGISGHTGAVNFGYYDTVGTHTVSIDITGNDQFYFISDSFDGAIDNVKITNGTIIPRNEAIPTQDVLGNDLQYTGRVKFNQTVVDSPAGLFGASDYVTTADHARNIPASLTVTCSVVFDSLPNYSGIMTNKKSANYGFGLVTTGGTLRVIIGTGGGFSYVGSTSLTIGKKYNVAASYDAATTTTKIYIDGSQVHSSSADTMSYGTDTSGKFVVGPYYITGGIGHNGTICNSKFFNKALSASQMLDISNQVKGVGSANLVAHLPIGETSGTTIYNKADENNPGTLVSSDVPAFRLGKQTGFNDFLDNGGSISSILTKTGSGTWNAGAFSKESLSGDGEVKFIAQEAYLMQGLSNVNSGEHYDDIPYAIYTRPNNTFSVYELGVNKINAGSFFGGDTLKIKRTGTQITYYKNDVLFYTSLVASTGDLFADNSFFGTSSSISHATMNGAYITWTDLVGVINTPNYVPALNDGSGNDCLGNPIEYPAGDFWNKPPSKELPVATPTLLEKFVHGGTFDGSTQYFTLTAPKTFADGEAWTCKFFCKYVQSSASYSIPMGSGLSSGGYLTFRDNGVDRIGFRPNLVGAYSTFSAAPVVGVSAEYKFICDGSTIELFINNVSQGSISPNSTAITFLTVGRGYSNNNYNLEGRLSGFILKDATTVYANEPLNGTLNAATLTGSATTFWVEEHNNLMFDANGVPIPYDSVDIDGNYLGLNRFFSNKSNSKYIKDIVLVEIPLLGSELAKMLKFTNNT